MQVFKPPCPWTMGLMNLLAELHAEPDLKLNLKFEIEVRRRQMIFCIRYFQTLKNNVNKDSSGVELPMSNWNLKVINHLEK